MQLYLHNSITNKKEVFEPLDKQNIKMYVCGPTVYDRPHLGNARAVVVYDVLFKLLKYVYGSEAVTYVRNITDVDDKINKAALDNKESIQSLTTRITKLFHDDMAALNNERPNIEPKATENIDEIIKIIQNIITNGHGYVAEGHVLFDVNSVQTTKNYHYGILSGKIQEDLIAGARIEVETYKKHPSDFVLWKPASEKDDESSVFNSPWGRGRPGWHIECSAMSHRYLGENFDIHGGGADLKFPHHENEIVQSRCAFKNSNYAKYWVHNGFLTVNGEKMSKSLGNFTTVNDLLQKGINGEVIRFALLSAHYRKPLDFNDKLIEDAKKNLDKFYGIIETFEGNAENPPRDFIIDNDIQNSLKKRGNEAFDNFIKALLDDMNVPLAISHLYVIAKGLRSFNIDQTDYKIFRLACDLLGICGQPAKNFLQSGKAVQTNLDDDLVKYIEAKIAERTAAKANKNFQLADAIRAELEAKNILLIDSKDGVKWEQKV